jgi:hypothetical protein
MTRRLLEGTVDDDIAARPNCFLDHLIHHHDDGK